MQKPEKHVFVGKDSRKTIKMKKLSFMFWTLKTKEFQKRKEFLFKRADCYYYYLHKEGLLLS